MRNLKSDTIVVKIGTSSLTYDNGKMNFKFIDELTMVLCNLKNQGKNVVLVSSGAIGVGVSKLRLSKRPDDIKTKQATAAVGQCQLMSIYDRCFSLYGQDVAQILITKYVIDNEQSKTNAKNTLDELFKMNVVPIVNENDVISTAEIEFGDNDTLSAYVAELINADLLIILTDIDGYYTQNPKENKNARLVPEINEITPEIMEKAGGAGSTRGTGGMYTKLLAAQIALKSDIATVITSGKNPNDIYSIVEGKEIGTLIRKKKD